MNNLIKILSGIGLLIGIFLVINQGDSTSKLVNTISSNSIRGIKVLQGR